MGKTHSYRKYKKALEKNSFITWEVRKTKWPGNFHPKQVYNMLSGRSFYLPNEKSFKFANITDLTEAQFNVFALPFLVVSYSTFDRLVNRHLNELIGH